MVGERFLCTHCKKTFKHEGGKLRCPSCLRQNGIEPAGARSERVDRAGEAARGKRLWLLMLALIFGAAAVVGATLLLGKKRGDVPKPGQLALLDSVDLARTLRARGVPDERRVNPLRVTSAVGKLAAAGEGKQGADKARAIAKAIGGRLAKVTPLLSQLGKAPIRDAATLAEALKAGKVTRATSLELATLTAAALRAAELAAVVGEVHRVDGAKLRSADVTGALGRYVVVVYPDGAKLGQAKPLVVLDPVRACSLPTWAGEGGDATMTAKLPDKPKLLDDGSLAAHVLSQAAQVSSRHGRAQSADAYELSKLALAAAAPSATLRLARAMVLASAGGAKDALGEAERAAQLRGDPPRRTAWARLLLSQGDGERGKKQLAAALKEDPKFWPALLTDAMVRWASGEREEGDDLLDKAREVAPEEPAVLALVAERQLGGGKIAEGVALLQKAAAMEPVSAPILFKLYVALRKLGRKQQADKVGKRLLVVAPDREQIERAFKAIDAAEKRAAAAATQPAPGDSDGDSDGAAGSPGAGGVEPPPPMPKMPKLQLPDVKLGK